MAYKITEDCISCGACEPECKNEAITEGEEIYIINPDKCTECVGWFETQNVLRFALWIVVFLTPVTRKHGSNC